MWERISIQMRSKLWSKQKEQLRRRSQRLKTGASLNSAVSECAITPASSAPFTNMWGHLGIILASSWHYVGAILGSSWHYVGGMLGSLLYFSWIIFRLSWNHFGVILGSFFKYLELILRSSWYYIGTSLGSHWGHRGKKIFSSNGVAPDNFWDHIGNTFGPSVYQSEFILGSFYIHFGIILRSSWNHVGVISDSFWCHLGIIAFRQQCILYRFAKPASQCRKTKQLK